MIDVTKRIVVAEWSAHRDAFIHALIERMPWLDERTIAAHYEVLRLDGLSPTETLAEIAFSVARNAVARGAV